MQGKLFVACDFDCSFLARGLVTSIIFAYHIVMVKEKGEEDRYIVGNILITAESEIK